jgi:hypothetical protein
MTEIYPTAKDIAESIDRIARTADGANLYVLLQRKLMTVSGAATDGALYVEHGERKFAATLIDLMKQGIFDSGGRTSSTSSTGSTSGNSDREQPVVVPAAKPHAVSAPRAGGRRITPDTRVAGWDRPEDA